MSVNPAAQQAELYGATIGGSVRRISATLGLSQAAVARVLGISAPMLSQLVHAQRIKVGNPLALQRLQSLLALADEVDSGLAHDAVAPRLEAIAAEESTTLTRRRDPSAPAEASAAISGVLRAVAGGREIAEAAALLAATHPEVAELLRVYGTGTPEEARRHYETVAHLLH
ncbi:MAG: hypothetical protein ACR2K3_13325 [Nocardioides sp.]